MPAIFITDNTRDYRSIDGMEAVIYEAARRARPVLDNDPQLRKWQDVPSVFDPAARKNANDSFAIQFAKRRVPTTSEKSPSGGVYIAYEANWTINLDQFPQGIVPKEADVVIDSDGNRFTVLKWWLVQAKSPASGGFQAQPGVMPRPAVPEHDAAFGGRGHLRPLEPCTGSRRPAGRIRWGTS
jgi:hypothetical protein